MPSSNFQQDDAYQYLLNLLCNSKDEQQVSKLLSALLTDKEQQEIINRLYIFAGLQAGQPQRTISHDLRVGIATVSRGAKAFQHFSTEDLFPNINQLTNNT